MPFKKVALGLVMVLMAVSAVQAKGFAPSRIVPTEPYGTPDEQWACIRNMQASGYSPLGPRGTSGYIQDRGNLESNGVTETDVMLWRCMRQFYHEYTRA